MARVSVGRVVGGRDFTGWVFGFAFVFFSFLAMPHGMWDLISPTRGRTSAPCSGSAVLPTGLLGEFP